MRRLVHLLVILALAAPTPAIASFQRAAGLPVDGMASIELSVALAKAFGGGPSPEGRDP